MKHIRILKWSEFQAYKDRKPQWIKLYSDLLLKQRFMCLPNDQKWIVVGLWLIACRLATAEEEPLIRMDPKYLAWHLRLDTELDLTELINALPGWFEIVELDNEGDVIMNETECW